MTSAVIELMRAAYFRATRSSQPVRRGRPVVVPNSPPRSRISAPTSSSGPVGNGPARPRDGAGAHARRLPLRDAPDLVDVARPDARADARRARDRVRGGHERIRAVV